MTAPVCAALGVVGLVDGWLTDNGAVLSCGFLCLLVAFACLLGRDWKTNQTVLFDRETM